MALEFNIVYQPLLRDPCPLARARWNRLLLRTGRIAPTFTTHEHPEAGGPQRVLHLIEDPQLPVTGQQSGEHHQRRSSTLAQSGGDGLRGLFREIAQVLRIAALRRGRIGPQNHFSTDTHFFRFGAQAGEHFAFAVEDRHREMAGDVFQRSV